MPNIEPGTTIGLTKCRCGSVARLNVVKGGRVFHTCRGAYPDGRVCGVQDRESKVDGQEMQRAFIENDRQPVQYHPRTAYVPINTPKENPENDPQDTIEPDTGSKPAGGGSILDKFL